jgi:hypothetical protein
MNDSDALPDYKTVIANSKPEIIPLLKGKVPVVVKSSISKKQRVTGFFENLLWILIDTITVQDSSPQLCSTLRLDCFNIPRFIFFILGTVIVPYFLYQWVSTARGFTERREKSRSEHFETIVTAIAYMVMLWFVGNYSHNFDWVTFLAVSVSILSYGAIAELPFAHESLTSIDNWNSKMWALFIGAIILIVILAGYHIYLAVKVGNHFWIVYLLCLLIPITLGFSAYQVTKDQNNDQSETKKVRLHVHHIHIFLTLAFFTRFPNLISRIAAGTVIGCSLQGAAAYGYDTTFENSPRIKK